MQANVIKENYNRKLDGIIEYFKTLKETWTFYLIIDKEDRKHFYNYYMSIFAILLAGVFSILNFDSIKQNLELLYFIKLIVGLLFFSLSLLIISYSKFSYKINRKIIDKTIDFNCKISLLQSLKILPYEVDLSKLENKIKFYEHLDTFPSIKDGNYISKTWFKEVDVCLNEINKEILEKEEITPLQQKIKR